ncbi:MAG: DUF134 domain-containing protein [Caldithrix sp.]|nr:DUF134 domain-containing protein [Caldithrix sp.]
MRNAYRRRRVQTPPKYNNFKPSGVPRKLLSIITLTVDEYEAIRLADYEGMQHQEASEEMHISRPTFTRLIDKAHQKISIALTEGKELIIEGGNVDFDFNLYRCHDCGDLNQTDADELITACPDCGSVNLEDYAGHHRMRFGKKHHP